jgi:hypothetical protein
MFCLLPPLTPPTPLPPRRAEEGSFILLLRAGCGITAVRLRHVSSRTDFRDGVPSVGWFVWLLWGFTRAVPVLAGRSLRCCRTVSDYGNGPTKQCIGCSSYLNVFSLPGARNSVPDICAINSATQLPFSNSASGVGGQIGLPSSARRGGRGAGGSEWGKCQFIKIRSNKASNSRQARSDRGPCHV